MKRSLVRLLALLSRSMSPLLKRVLPMSLLRSVKGRVQRYSAGELEGYRPRPFEPARWERGVNLIGNIRGEIGLGQSCRLVARALEASGLPFTIVHYQQASAMRHGDHSWDRFVSGTMPYGVNLWHINPYEIPLAFTVLGKEAFDGHYNIAFWLWELETFPEEWRGVLPLFDEIWTPSAFVSDCIRQVTPRPVRTMPYPIEAPVDPAFDRAFFHLPQRAFLFLAMYDCNSTMERKNPLGALRAYRQAFCGREEDVGLVVKVNNPQPKDLALLRDEVRDAGHVYLLTDILSKVQVNSLISCADAFVSLHRSEGFGLVLAEAMLLGTPVIATNWSANAEFMDESNACPVDFRFTTLERDVGPYRRGSRWADPDTGQAAQWMRRLREDRGLYERVAGQGRRTMALRYSPQAAAQMLRAWARELYGD